MIKKFLRGMLIGVSMGKETIVCCNKASSLLLLIYSIYSYL
jgi:hypothetical protein